MVGVISSSEETAQQTLLREPVRDSHSFLPFFLIMFTLADSCLFTYFFREYHSRLYISTAALGDATHTRASSSHLQPPQVGGAAAGRRTHLVPQGFDACLFLRPQLLLRRHRDECGCRGPPSVGITPRRSPEGSGGGAGL